MNEDAIESHMISSRGVARDLKLACGEGFRVGLWRGIPGVEVVARDFWLGCGEVFRELLSTIWVDHHCRGERVLSSHSPNERFLSAVDSLLDGCVWRSVPRTSLQEQLFTAPVRHVSHPTPPPLPSNAPQFVGIPPLYTLRIGCGELFPPQTGPPLRPVCGEVFLWHAHEQLVSHLACRHEETAMLLAMSATVAMDGVRQNAESSRLHCIMHVFRISPSFGGKSCKN